MPTPLKVAVIGAGVCGLVAARELEREAHEVVVLEKSHRLGGVWVYDPRTESDLLGIDPDREIIHATIYKSLRTNSPRQIMGYSDYMLGGKVYGDPRMFPGHQEFLSYLEDFADTFGVTKLIRFNSEVTGVELLDFGNEFVVDWKTNGMSLTEVFDSVVVCNGHNSQPRAALDTQIDHVFKDGTVKFQDEVLIKADTIIHCTGYEFHFPFLKTNGIVTIDDKCVSPTYGSVFPPQLAPRLSFVGLFYKGMTFLPAELQSKWIARVLSGKISLPSETEMLHEVEQVYQEMKVKGIPKSESHSLNFKMDYIDWLSDQLKIARPPQKFRDFYAHFIERYRKDNEGFQEKFEDDLLLCDEIVAE
ncbi:flavin-containing monooxygenase FMO GS-OX5-like [Bidens hawaiensis]|uniref:flavin-containing monooxygenase FMO GS-OX5-like n=1 Tax=Bidens hawaiensis TaxID=980011 RepID=UPI00404A7B57